MSPLPPPKFFSKTREGFSVVELLVALGIFVLIFGSVSLLIFSASDLSEISSNQLKALYYAKEGLEAVRAVRDADWENLTPGEHGLIYEGNIWAFAGTSELLDDKYTRKIVLTSRGADKYEIESKITWTTKRNRTGEVSLSTFLTDWRTAGEASAPVIVNLGETANDIYVLGSYAYLALNNQHQTLGIINVSNPQNPSLVSKTGFSGRGEDVFVLGNYAYIPIHTNKVAIVNISNPLQPQQVSLILLSAQPTSIFVKDGYAYIGQSKKNEGLTIYNVANPQSPRFYRSYNVGSEVYDVKVLGYWIYMAVNLGRGLDLEGNYGYVAVDVEQGGFEVYDISKTPTIYYRASVNVGGRGSNTDVFGNRAYVAVKNQSGGLAKVDISLPTSPQLLGVVNVGGEGNDVFYKDNYAYMAVQNAGGGFAIVSLGN